MDKEYMTITRVLSPPMENPKERIHNGEVLSKENIINLVNKLSGNPRHYYYQLTHFRLNKNRLIIDDAIRDYNQLSYDCGGNRNTTIIHIDNSIREDLIEFLK